MVPIFRLLPGKIFWSLRYCILRINGCKLQMTSYVYSTTIIVAPHELELGTYSTIGPRVYVGGGPVKIGSCVTISQEAMLLPSSHLTKGLSMEYCEEEIKIDDNVWVAARGVVGPGVHLQKRVVIGAGSVYFTKSSETNTIYVGNPARKVRSRY